MPAPCPGRSEGAIWPCRRRPLATERPRGRVHPGTGRRCFRAVLHRHDRGHGEELLQGGKTGEPASVSHLHGTGAGGAGGAASRARPRCGCARRTGAPSSSPRRAGRDSAATLSPGVGRRRVPDPCPEPGARGASGPVGGSAAGATEAGVLLVAGASPRGGTAGLAAGESPRRVIDDLRRRESPRRAIPRPPRMRRWFREGRWAAPPQGSSGVNTQSGVLGDLVAAPAGRPGQRPASSRSGARARALVLHELPVPCAGSSAPDLAHGRGERDLAVVRAAFTRMVPSGILSRASPSRGARRRRRPLCLGGRESPPAGLGESGGWAGRWRRSQPWKPAVKAGEAGERRRARRRGRCGAGSPGALVAGRRRSSNGRPRRRRHRPYRRRPPTPAPSPAASRARRRLGRAVTWSILPCRPAAASAFTRLARRTGRD